jgi:hypothetical protein
MADESSDRVVVDPFPPGFGMAEGPRPVEPPPLRPRRRRMPWGRWLGLALVALAVAGLIVAAPWDPERRQAYADQWIVWTEPPAAHIAELADDLALTETGRRIFFASRPQIDDASDFQQHCPLEGDIVLGCYGGERIYVYRVTDERLDGTVEATAAHELLHAVYDRMTPEEAARIDALVAAYVATLPTDDENVRTVAGYPESQHADEWHSRLGTDYAQLPVELERHYAEIFADRARIVAFAQGSTAELDGYTDRIEQLSAELAQASDDLSARAAAYDDAIARLNADIEDFNARAEAGAFDSQEEFDAERHALLDRQDALESDRLQLNADVDAYNAKLAELSALDAERAELFSHLDSRSAPK